MSEEVVTDYSLKKMRKKRQRKSGTSSNGVDTDQYKPKTLMEQHPIVVEPSKTIPVSTDKVIPPTEDAQRKRKKRVKIVPPNEGEDDGCKVCSRGCHCKGWDKEVSHKSGQRFY